jgi:hypothetical protein
MTETPIDYETAFAELNKLNYLFGNHAAYTIPRLNPVEFETTHDDGSLIVVRGLRSGIYYGSSRVRTTDQYGNDDYHYTALVRVTPEKRTVTDWVRP